MDRELLLHIQERAKDPKTRTDMAKVFVSPHFRAVTEEELHEAQSRLGFTIPVFLAEVYLLVGNGGFGPGYGLIGLPGGYLSGAGDDMSVIELYEEHQMTDPEDPSWKWPPMLVPICDWGCAIYSCADCTSALGPVITFDPGSRRSGEPMSLCLAQSHPSVEAWFDEWTQGVRLWDKMFENDPEGARESINPVTKKRLIIPKRRLRRQ